MYNYNNNTCNNTHEFGIGVRTHSGHPWRQRDKKKENNQEGTRARHCGSCRAQWGVRGMFGRCVT